MSTVSVPEPLAAEPALSIRDYLGIIRRRKMIFIQVFFLVLAIGIVVTWTSKSVYRTQAKLLVPVSSPSLRITDASNPIAEVLGTFQPDPLSTQLQVLQSGPFISDARREAEIAPKPGVPPPSVRVEAVRGTNVIQISVEGGDRNDIAKLANTMVELHLERTSASSTEGLTGTIEFVTQQRREARERLQEAENRLIEYRRQVGYSELMAEQEAQGREFVAIRSRVREAEANITFYNAQIEEIQARLEREPLELVQESQRDNPEHERLRTRLRELEHERLDLLREYQPTSQRVQSLDERIALQRQLLEAEPEQITVRNSVPNTAREALARRLAEMETSIQGHQAAYNEATAQLEVRRGMLADHSPVEIQIGRLNQERENAQAAYTMFSNRLRDLEIRSKASVQMARVIERAGVPGSPIRPRRGTNVALAFVLAFCFAAGVAFLQEYLDDRVNSPEDVERSVGLPTLGHVPLMNVEQPRLLAALPANSVVSEAYRALRSSVGFAAIDSPIRRLLVTSPSKGEGKTVTSVNLATAMAMDGKRVILIDADLRRPSVHRVLEIPSAPGLSEVLVGMKTPEEAIRDTDVENLRVLPAGPIPPNPAELLGSRAFDDLIEQLEQQADIVMFDSPPCIPVTDPLLVAARMDGVVLVLHVGQTRKAALKHAEELLARARARVVGVLLNQVQQGRGGYYHYYYYYGDGYYSEEARNGERKRRNGRGRRPRLASGKSVEPVSGQREDDD